VGMLGRHQGESEEKECWRMGGGGGGTADWALRWAALRWFAGRVAFVLRAVFSTSAFMRDRVLSG
jgi:hypothetical protein